MNYESAKPIEPGCLVMIINMKGDAETANGFITTAVDCMELHDSVGIHHGWIVEPRPVEMPSEARGIGEGYLMRIDDPDLQKGIEEEKTTPTPEREEVEALRSLGQDWSVTIS